MMHRNINKIINIKIRDILSNLCAKLETDPLRRGAPWATEIYLPPPLGLGIVQLKYRSAELLKFFFLRFRILNMGHFCTFE